MEMAMNMGAFEALNDDELMLVDGGINWWGVASGALTIVAGGISIAGGCCMLATPEPTGLTKAGGYLAISGGVASIASGITSIMWALE